MQNKEEKPIVVNMADGQNTLKILQGQAPQELDQLAPVKIDIAGTLEAPLRWLEKRVEDIDQHETHILVDRDRLSIELVLKESDPYLRGSVCGKLEFSDIFETLGINRNKPWVPEQLGQFLKLNRVYFPNREENMVVVNALKTFTAKVNQDVQRETKENGNRTMVFRQAVDSNMPEVFKMRLPIYKGGEPVDIDVETYASIDGVDVTVMLQSAGAVDAVEDLRVNYIGKVLDSIREIAPDIVIIEE